jgi:hypothetical protein
MEAGSLPERDLKNSAFEKPNVKANTVIKKEYIKSQ